MNLLGPVLSRSADTPVLASGQKAWTGEALAREVEARAGKLLEEISPGGLWIGSVVPDAGGIVELLAAWSLGAVVVPLDPGMTPAERARARSAMAGVQRKGGLPPGTAAVLWTSGTTGEPRGVALTGSGLRASATASARRLGLSPSDVWYASLSLAHVGGLALVTRALLLGSALVMPGRFQLEAMIDALRYGTPVGRPTHLSLVPTQLHRLLEAWEDRAPPSGLRCVLLGGAATPEDLLRTALEAGWPVALTYGMTEMTSQAATAPPDRVRRKPGTVGRPLPGVDVRVAEDGEILLRGITCAAGYVPGNEPLGDPEGWYRTGDLGRVDADGDLWITGRRSHRIISGGVTVDPHEVEAVLRTHPAIRDACVVGIPDPEWGERVAALVDTAGREVADEELARWAAERLGPARRPRLWAATPGLPLNRNGKVDRPAVKALFEDA